MKRNYISPETASQEPVIGGVLMASGGNGRTMSSNIGLKIGSQTLDPNQAW